MDYILCLNGNKSLSDVALQDPCCFVGLVLFFVCFGLIWFGLVLGSFSPIFPYFSLLFLYFLLCLLFAPKFNSSSTVIFLWKKTFLSHRCFIDRGRHDNSAEIESVFVILHCP